MGVVDDPDSTGAISANFVYEGRIRGVGLAEDFAGVDVNELIDLMRADVNVGQLIVYPLNPTPVGQPGSS